jgi:uncharacterized protein with HEPN domain
LISKTYFTEKLTSFPTAQSGIRFSNRWSIKREFNSMPPETAKLLYDMKMSAERIGRFTVGKTLDDYLRDEYFRSAVERQFEIIGEAMARLIKRDRATAEKITEYRGIAGFRNALIHGYDSIDDDTTWRIITTKHPILLKEVSEMMPPLPE